jgi:hypothetical protein
MTNNKVQQLKGQINEIRARLNDLQVNLDGLQDHTRTDDSLEPERTVQSLFHSEASNRVKITIDCHLSQAVAVMEVQQQTIQNLVEAYLPSHDRFRPNQAVPWEKFATKDLVEMLSYLTSGLFFDHSDYCDRLRRSAEIIEEHQQFEIEQGFEENDPSQTQHQSKDD